MRSWRLVLLVLPLVAALACSDDGPEAAPATTTTTTAEPRPEPTGPLADLSEALTGGNGVFLAGAPALAPGWVEEELVAAGTATAYREAGDGLAEASTAPYRTRVVVRRPPDDDFGGTAVVEWLNVSAGLDSAPDHAFTADELARRGMAWVGVSAQLIGVEGGAVAVSAGAAGDAAGAGLKGLDAERYGSLSHPGDAFAYDIYSQVGRAARQLLDADRVLAVGESQSAFALTTYVNGVHPLARAYDGFLLHSRGGAALPLGEPGEAVSIASAIGGPPVTIRDDVGVPVLVLETETDLVSIIGYLPARQPDSDTFRLWEVAGTAHADRSVVGAIADTLDCGVAINDGPQRFVVRAALRALDEWVADGTPPPEAPRLEVGGGAIVRDADGIALGGIRLPQVDVPVATLSGEAGPRGGVICLLLGSTVPFTDEQVAARHPSRQAYLDAYEASADSAIEAGFVVPEDRGELLADAEPDRIP